jgi:hypothetical protein
VVRSLSSLVLLPEGPPASLIPWDRYQEIHVRKDLENLSLPLRLPACALPVLPLLLVWRIWDNQTVVENDLRDESAVHTVVANGERSPEFSHGCLPGRGDPKPAVPAAAGITLPTVSTVARKSVPEGAIADGGLLAGRCLASGASNPPAVGTAAPLARRSLGRAITGHVKAPNGGPGASLDKALPHREPPGDRQLDVLQELT